MAKIKKIDIEVYEKKGSFYSIKKSSSKENYDFKGLSALRTLLNNEKMRLLHVIKTKKPNSIYQLSRILGRTFKSVSDDIKLLERFGFIELIEEKTKKRKRHKPEIISDSININIKI